MKVIKITPADAAKLRAFDNGTAQFIWPIQDGNGDWVISIAEYENPMFADVMATLESAETIEFVPLQESGPVRMAQ